MEVTIVVDPGDRIREVRSLIREMLQSRVYCVIVRDNESKKTKKKVVLRGSDIGRERKKLEKVFGDWAWNWDFWDED